MRERERVSPRAVHEFTCCATLWIGLSGGELDFRRRGCSGEEEREGNWTWPSSFISLLLRWAILDVGLLYWSAAGLILRKIYGFPKHLQPVLCLNTLNYPNSNRKLFSNVWNLGTLLKLIFLKIGLNICLIWTTMYYGNIHIFLIKSSSKFRYFQSDFPFKILIYWF